SPWCSVLSSSAARRSTLYPVLQAKYPPPKEVCVRVVLYTSLGDDSPDKENDDGTDDRADEAGALAGCVPSKRLPEIARHDRSHDAEDRRQHETRGLVAAPW